MPHQPVVSPEVGADRRVTFRLVAPDASRVVVAIAVSPSQFSINNYETLPMRQESGVWIGTTESLAPDIYAYAFGVDGKVVSDPANSRFIEEFGEVQTSAVVVPGALWTTPAARAGEVTRHSYESAALGKTEEYVVYTPPGYDATRAEPYPVLYLLHGMGDNAYTWVSNGGVHVTVDNLLAQGRATPMVVVMPLSYGGTGSALMAFDSLEPAMVKEIVPRIEASYHVARTRERRAIAGVSMGGSHAVTLALRQPDSFAWVGSLSGAFQMGSPADFLSKRPIAADRFALMYLGWGAEDDLAYLSQELAAGLRARGAVVTANEVAGVGHVWPLWRQMIGEFVPLLFKSAAR
jgi:enterochelin esterase family protein